MRIIPLPDEATQGGGVVHRLWLTPDQCVVLLGQDEGANALCWLDRAGQALLERLKVGDDEHDSAVPAPEFSADQRYLALPDVDGRGVLAVVERSAPQPRRVVLQGPRGAGPLEQYGCVTFSPDGAFLVAARSVALVAGLWPIHRWAVAAALEANEERLRPEPDSEIRCRSDFGPAGLAISPDGKYLAAITYDGALGLIWEFATGELVAELELAAGVARRLLATGQPLRFSPDQRTLAVAGAELAVFDVPTWELRHQLETDSEVCGLAFHPEGRRLATVDNAAEVLLWDLATGAAQSLPCPDAGLLRALEFAPDGAALVAGGDEGRLVLWDLPPAPEA